MARDVAVPGVAEQLQSQQGANRTPGRDHLRAGQAGLLDDAVKRKRGQGGQEEEQAAELGVGGSRAEVELANIGDSGGQRVSSQGAVLVIASRQAGEAFLFEDLVNGHGADGLVLCGQGAADIVDGEVLLAQGDDAQTQGLLFRGAVGSLVRGKEEAAVGALAELAEQDTEAAVGVTEAFGDFRPGAALDDIGTQGLVLTLGGVGRFQEVLRQGCEVFSCAHKLTSTKSSLEQEIMPSRQMCRKPLEFQGFSYRQPLLLS
jgi:hypothetical protein